MEKQQQELSALQDIRNIMERSTRFLSLSGWSGIWAGAVALGGSVIAFGQLNKYYEAYEERGAFDGPAYVLLRNNLFYLAVSVFVIALAGAFLFTLRKVRQQNGMIWNTASRRFIANLAIPLGAGAAMVLAFLYHNDWQYVAASSLIFYGLSLYNAGKFTLNDIRYLGIIEVILGIICLFFPGLGLYFWSAGFGLMHIVYGVIMWNKYDRQQSAAA